MAMMGSLKHRADGETTSDSSATTSGQNSERLSAQPSAISDKEENVISVFHGIYATTIVKSNQIPR